MKKQILIIFLLLLFLILSSCQSFEKKDDPIAELKDYLEQNSISYNNYIEESKNTILLDKDINKYRVILTGEVHYYDKNEDVVLSFIKYLNKKHNVKYILCEYPFSFSQLYNKYLKTGDMSYLIKNHRIRFKERKQFLEKLYALNQTLPENNRIKMIGIDVENDFTNALIYQFLLLKDKVYQSDDNLKSLISLYHQVESKYIYGIDSQNSNYLNYQKKYYQIIDLIERNNISDPEYYIKILKNDYDNFFKSIESIKEGRKFVDELKKIGLGRCTLSDKEYRIRRDLIMCNNLIKTLEKYPDERFFGSFGYYHVFKLPEFANFKTFAQVLNENQKYKNIILSIPIMYQNKDNNYHDRNIVKNQYEELFFNLSLSNFSLYKLDSKKSPFMKKGKNILFYYPQNLIPKISTVDNFQYVIVVNGVNKIELLKDEE